MQPHPSGSSQTRLQLNGTPLFARQPDKTDYPILRAAEKISVETRDGAFHSDAVELFTTLLISDYVSPLSPDLER